MATLVIPEPAFSVSRAHSFEASDPRDGMLLRRYDRERSLRTWTVRSAGSQRAARLWFDQVFEASKGQVSDWTPPGGSTPIKVRFWPSAATSPQSAALDAFEFQLHEEWLTN
jgi:hypothetical protein